MKKIMLIFPIMINIILTIIYKYYSYTLGEEWLGFDYMIRIDGKKEIKFGIGLFSVCIITALIIITVIWIIKNKKLFKSQKAYKTYLLVSIIITLAIDGFWIHEYYECYLTGLHSRILEFIRGFIKQLCYLYEYKQ